MELYAYEPEVFSWSGLSREMGIVDSQLDLGASKMPSSCVHQLSPACCRLPVEGGD